jgi:hypothetical protein
MMTKYRDIPGLVLMLATNLMLNVKSEPWLDSLMSRSLRRRCGLQLLPACF